MLIDTHCHLNFKTFKGMVKKTIQEAKKAGINKIIVPGTDLESSQKAVELASRYRKVYASVGIHPHHALETKKLLTSNLLSSLEKLSKNKKVVAIGECGLDYYHYQKTKYQKYKIDMGFKKIQKKIFSLQIDLALKLNLPLIIHNRESSLNLLEIVSKKNKDSGNRLKGVFHSFQGSSKLLAWALKNGFFIGINGIVTFSKNIESVCKKVSLNNLVLETDSPFLMPRPVKNQKKWPNTPENVKIIAQRIANIKGDSFLRIAQQTSKNAVQLFKLNHD
ncbi:hydrolase TatD [Candidatus Beckwithbacteria bacterium CG10_big_fil_rev_8_21_14_0_10_34_10]|uniref:Hydrolase TatD n=1 Tax=Candidatus Beckwithbacteria bacterium CG10_big_fil_rev_8_21_14_0_10_34_10 TaxID=1974495 RepID=A0A2H0WBI1_9BACT|nr:MAG: hydrolase TatD [Candidatus Beckwithbacteria bacterium CG10_big_fil_rev_8_21_14_0_10_34_10]